MKKLIIVCCGLLWCATVLTAQTPVANPDSAKNAKAAKIEQQRRIRHKLMWTNDTITSGDYMMSIERVNDKLNSIRDSSKLSIQVLGLDRKADGITNDLALIQQYMGGRRARVNLRNLYLYQSFLNDLDDDTQRQKKILNTAYNRLYRVKLSLKNVMKDSIYIRLNRDTTMEKPLDQRIDRLERKWIRTDSIARAELNQLNVIKVKVSDNSMNIANMLNILDTRLDRAGMQLFRREAPYLWQFNVPDTVGLKQQKSGISTVVMEQKAIQYYFSQTTGERVVIFILALLLCWWLFTKRRVLRDCRDQKASFAFLNLKYLNTHAVLSVLTVLLSLMPFFDAYAPTLYITCEFLVLYLVVSPIFYAHWTRTTWYAWLILIVLFVAVAVSYVLTAPTLLNRLWMVFLQIAVIVFSIRFMKRLDEKVAFRKWIKVAALVVIFLSSLSILVNLFGRYSLSGIFGLASSFTLLQAITLPVFVTTILEMIVLQIQLRRLKRGINVSFDHAQIIKKLRWPLLAVAMLLWLIMLTSNLNIYHSLSDWLNTLLTSPRTIGSITFKLSSVLLFFVIIWFAHILQQLISFLFGETGNEADDLSTVSKGQHSRLLMMRLLVLCAGYLLAVAASGLPIDKITIVLGALGVGIGMGLQNVVNNFVSGIILIFDGSLQIGDVIEVSGQSGKVKEIGLRASTLSTSDGAEVIIPNGSILSQNIVNWTFSNDQRRVMIDITLTGDELDANVISELINATVDNIPNVIPKKKPVILFTQVQQRSCRLTVRFWCVISNTDQVKSDALLRLKEAFLTKGIMMG